jgi:pimeloyl-ACP methyl ester carboxylesterase
MALVTLPSGAQIWYRRTGAGAPLLHIHGSAYGHRNFEKMTPLMAQHFEVIDFDLPGYGESRGGPARPEMADLADLAAELIRAIGLARVHVHGTSFGAVVGLTLATRHPELIDRLVLSCFLARYDNAARMMRATWKRCAADSGMAGVADLTSVAGFGRAFFDRPEAQAQFESMREAFSRNSPESFIAAIGAIERSDLSPLIPKVKAKTLLIGGREDNMSPAAPAASGVGFAQIAAGIPGTEVVMIEDCGHYLVIEQPERAAAAIVSFIGSRVPQK